MKKLFFIFFAFFLFSSNSFVYAAEAGKIDGIDLEETSESGNVEETFNNTVVPNSADNSGTNERTKYVETIFGKQTEFFGIPFEEYPDVVLKIYEITYWLLVALIFIFIAAILIATLMWKGNNKGGGDFGEESNGFGSTKNIKDLFINLLFIGVLLLGIFGVLVYDLFFDWFQEKMGDIFSYFD